jgi:hypothetical protein
MHTCHSICHSLNPNAVFISLSYQLPIAIQVFNSKSIGIWGLIYCLMTHLFPILKNLRKSEFFLWFLIVFQSVILMFGLNDNPNNCLKHSLQKNFLELNQNTLKKFLQELNGAISVYIKDAILCRWFQLCSKFINQNVLY